MLVGRNEIDPENGREGENERDRKSEKRKRKCVKR